MSGIVGIFHRDGAPVERHLLQNLVDFLAYRGPEAQEIWTDVSVGLGHAMLRTTYESLGERQSAGLDGRLRITADARLDCRAELLADLNRLGRRVDSLASDSELILHAYAVWAITCVDHIRGDFAFVIWDAGCKTLFCARDHFGIKPFYYAQFGDSFLCSNDLNCLRLHRDVSAELNEAAIGDFLLFGVNCDRATTTFRDIRRLPPAHCLTVSHRALHIKRYWTPPTDGQIRYSRDEDYIEHFQTLLRSAVSDRLRTDRVGILLSGGLDSSSVAAVARDVSTNRARPTDICGYTHVFESLMPDREGICAREAGEFLGIPVKFLATDHVQLFDHFEDPDFSLPEPVDNPLIAGFFEFSSFVSTDCRVLLNGEGSDNLMHFQMWPYVEELLRKREWRCLSNAVAKYLWVKPFPHRGIRALVMRLVHNDPDAPALPPWLTPDFVRRLNLNERWKEWRTLPASSILHPIHPEAHASLTLPHWTQMFELENAGVTHNTVEIRYPFLDLRIVEYLLALPPFPWFFEKMLLREAMRGRLPESVRVRPKTPLLSDPLQEQLKRTGADRLNGMKWDPEVDRYIDRSLLVVPHGKMHKEQISSNLRPYCLSFWLQSAGIVRHKW